MIYRWFPIFSYPNLHLVARISQPCLMTPEGTSQFLNQLVLNWNLAENYPTQAGLSSTQNLIPVVPARGGAEVALKIYIRLFSSIELACAVRQPSPCVRALCESGVLFHMSHLKLHFALHTSHCTLHTPHCTLHTSHFTLHTSHCTLPNPHFTLHCTLPTAHSTLHTSHSTLHTSHSTLHTALFTPHTSHCTLHTPHFISSLLFSPYPSSSLLISSLLICHLSFHESLPSTTTKKLACAVRQPGPCVRALCEAVAVLLSKNMTCARPRYNANTFLTLHINL